MLFERLKKANADWRGGPMWPNSWWTFKKIRDLVGADNSEEKS